MIRGLLLISCAAVLLSSCGGARKGGYYEDDGPPGGGHIDIASIPDAVPAYAPPSKSGNKPYTTFGRVYKPLGSARGYRERGVASWYGKKFHGRRTASGERYDMFTMTAAHRTLPLPSYVRITNLKNHRSVVVKVNDRGPFLDNRLIDLSYAAAYKLDIVRKGTGLVEVTAVTADGPDGVPAGTGHDVTAGPLNPRLFIQVGAFVNQSNAENLRARLERENVGPVLIQTAYNGNTPVYRVRIGPLATVEEGDRLIVEIDRHGALNPRLVVD